MEYWGVEAQGLEERLFSVFVHDSITPKLGEKVASLSGPVWHDRRGLNVRGPFP